MRQVGTLNDADEAQRFADYLLTQGIAVKLDAGDDGCAIWVRDEDQLDRTRQELSEFARNPADPRYRQAQRPARQIRKEAAVREQQFRRNMVDLRSRWSQPTSGARPVTTLLILVSVVVTLLLSYSDLPVRQMLLIASTGSPEFFGLTQIVHGQVWRLVTPIFLHFGLLHILFNMLWLNQLGGLIEIRRGTRYFVLLVLLIAVTSNLAQYFTSGPAFGGMSGVVFGLFGYVWMKSRYEPGSGFYLDPTTVFLMIAFLVACYTGYIGRIANTAHTVGLIVGMLVGAWRYLGQRMGGR